MLNSFSNKYSKKKVYDKNLIEDLGADSLDTVQIVMELEEAFNVEITDDEAETLTTVGAIKQYIEDYS